MLIVEEEAAISLQMADVLVSAGIEVAIAADGFAAGKMLATFDPDVMTLDLRMPGMPGIEVLKELRSRNQANSMVWRPGGSVSGTTRSTPRWFSLVRPVPHPWLQCVKF